jgi:hypothetical protein
MFVEKRPTCVTVIGWAWIILGGLGSIAAISAFAAFLGGPPMGTSFDWAFPLLAGVQLIICVVGFVSGVLFLKLRAGARGVLEVLTWAALGLAGLASLYPIVLSLVAGQPMFIGELVILGMIAAIYLVPFGIMLRYLRGARVRAAFELGAGA